MSLPYESVPTHAPVALARSSIDAALTVSGTRSGGYTEQKGQRATFNCATVLWKASSGAHQINMVGQSKHAYVALQLLTTVGAWKERTNE